MFARGTPASTIQFGVAPRMVTIPQLYQLVKIEGKDWSATGASLMGADTHLRGLTREKTQGLQADGAGLRGDSHLTIVLSFNDSASCIEMLRSYLPCALILDVLDPQRSPHVHQNPQGSFGLSVFRAVPGDSSGVHRDLVV